MHLGVTYNLLKRLLAAIGVSAVTGAIAAPPYAPYRDRAGDGIYNLLFCDNTAAFVQIGSENAAPWQALLTADPPDPTQLRHLAMDTTQEGRIRALAFNKLRLLGQEVPKHVVLGVVTEVGLEGGLDTLAAFSEGGVRYINQSAKMAFVEGRIEQTKESLPKLFAAAQNAVNQLKPLDGPRWAPPPRNTVRFTFITSEGLYFGQGPMSAMQRDPMGAAILEAATELLLTMVKLGTQ